MLMPKMQCNMNSEIAKKKSCDWKFHSKWQQAVGIESVNYKLIGFISPRSHMYIS